MLTKLLRNNLPDTRVVVAHQDQAFAALSGIEAGMRRCIGCPRRSRELHPQRRARSGIVRLRPDRPAVLLDNAAADRQPQPGAALLAGIRGLDLLESPEYGLQFVRRDPASAIHYFHQHRIHVGIDMNRDRCAGRRKLDGVREQVCDHLQDAVRVGVEVDRLPRCVADKLKLNSLALRHRPHGIDRLAGEVLNGAAAQPQRRAPGLHPLQIQNVVDQPDQPLGVAGRDAQQILRLGIHLTQHARREQPQRSADARQRCAEFVRDRGDELVLNRVHIGAQLQLRPLLLRVLAAALQGLVELFDGFLLLTGFLRQSQC